MTVELELREAERALYAAMVRKDTAALEAMLHDDLIFVHSTALVEDRPTYLVSVAANRYRYESIVPRPRRHCPGLRRLRPDERRGRHEHDPACAGRAWLGAHGWSVATDTPACGPYPRGLERDAEKCARFSGDIPL